MDQPAPRFNDRPLRWREEVQTRVSRAIAIGASPVAVAVTLAAAREQVYDEALIVVIGFGLLVWAAYARVSHSVRAATTMGALIALGLGVIVYVGPAASTAVLLSAGVILSLLTLGPSAAALALGLSTLGYALAAYGMTSYRWDPFGPIEVQAARAVRLVVLFPVFTGGAALAVHFIIRRLEFSVESLNQVSTALRHSEAQFRELFDKVPVGVFQTSPDGRILMANPAHATMLGFTSPDQLRNLPVRDFYEVPADRDAVAQSLEAAGEVRNVEVRLRRADGRALTALLSARVVRDVSGAALQFEGTLVDITEHKHLEDQLLQARKMEAIGRLAGGIAHDFNNLLTAILGFAQLARERDPGSERQSHDLMAVETAAQSAAHLTRQLLTFSRKQMLQPRVTDLNAVVASGRALLGRVIGEDIEIVTGLAPQLPHVLVDAGQIEQVILNLGINARDAMPRGGRLTIETFATGTPAGEVCLAISDTGVGIDASALTHIFEPFFTTKEPGRGTGLGLATVYGIVEQSGGTIDVRSEPGKGTRFQIHFPRATESAPPPEPERAPLAAGGVETILLVEDEPEVRLVAREILEQAGYTVLEAASGAEAVEVFGHHGKAIDLVLTDVIMPAMSGPALAERFKASALDVPFVFMSGYTDDALERRGLATANMPFLPKPFTVDGLLSKIRQVLDDASRVTVRATPADQARNSNDANPR